MSLIPNIINYFHDCYQADFRAVHLLNFFGNKVSDTHFLPDLELLSGSLNQLPVSTDWAKDLYKSLIWQSKEKTLLCGAFFLSCETSVFGKTMEVFAPLLIFPADILFEDGIYSLTVNFGETIVNPAFSECLKTADSQGIHEQLAGNLPKGRIDFDEWFLIEEVLSKYFPDLDISPLKNYPEILTEEKIKAFRKDNKSKVKPVLLPAVGIGLVKKATAREAF